MANILGIPFSSKTMEETLNVLNDHLEQKQTPFHVVTANPEIVMQAKRDRKFRGLMKKADIITPDGIGIVIGAKILKENVPERVSGYDIIVNLLQLREESKRPTKVFLLGAKEENVSKAAVRLKEMYEHVEVVGYHHGYFQAGSETETSIVSTIHSSKPDLLLVGFGSPRQEQFIQEHLNELQAKILIGCGGSIDVLSGAVERAPLWVQKSNLEWAYRLVKEPKRLKRQLDIPRFLIEVVKEKRKK